MRERGLKSLLAVPGEHLDESLPMRERGLKYVAGADAVARLLVAPHAGAWIGIERRRLSGQRRGRRSPCGSVD